MNEKLRTKTNWRHHLYLLVGLLTLLLNARSLQGQMTLSLSAAIENGIKNSFSLKKRQLETQMTRNKLKHAAKERLPRVNFSIDRNMDFVNDRSPISFVDGFYKDSFWSLGAHGSWSIFDGFQSQLNKRLYQTLETQSSKAEKIAIENTIYKVTQAYYQVLMQQEALKVARQTQQLSLERYIDAQTQRNLGKASDYDVLRFENAWLTDSSAVTLQKNRVSTTLLLLNKTMHNKRNIPYQITDKFQFTPRNYNMAAYRKKLNKTNLILKQQALQLDILALNKERIQKDGLPKLLVVSGLNQRFNATNFPEIRSIKSNTFRYNIQFSAQYNLFNRGVLKRALEEQRLREEIAELQITETQAMLANELEIAIASYHRQLEVVEIKEQLIQNLKKGITLERERQVNGLSSPLNFRTIQLEYTNAQYDQLRAIYDLLVNEMNILKLTGELTKQWKNRF